MKSNESVIAESIDYLVAHYHEQPNLEFLAGRAGYETSYFQKLFKDKVGISPKRLQQYMNARHARELLGDGATTEQASLDMGLSSTSRLHDLFVSCEGITPGDLQSRGQGLEIVYGFAPTILGELMIGKTPRGVCWCGFLIDEDRIPAIHRLHHHWPRAKIHHDDAAVMPECTQMIQIWSGQEEGRPKMKLDLYGTSFQLQVWQALLKIPGGETLTYQDIAKNLGRPKSSRAVGNAVGANPISLLIPCHRVIRGTGIIDNYGWGSPRKKLILAMEGAR